MTIWGTIYSYLFGNEIKYIYQEAETAYQESEKLQDDWVYMAEAPLTELLLHKPKDISSSELRLLTEVLGEGADKKLSNPLYESFINHVTQEIAMLDKMIDVMSQKYNELPPLESIRANMFSVLEKLKAKHKDLVAFKGRIILLANVNGEVKDRFDSKVVSVDLVRATRLPPPPPMPMPMLLPNRKTPPITILRNKVEPDIKLGPNPYPTMIELLQRGVQLRKLTDNEKKQQLPDDVQKELINAIRFKQYRLRTVKNVKPLPVKTDLRSQLLLELKEKKLTMASLRKIEESKPVRKISKPDSLQSQMEDVLLARRCHFQNISDSDNDDKADSEWDSDLSHPVGSSEETKSLIEREEEDVVSSFEDSSISSLLFHSSDIEESLLVSHPTSPILDLDDEDVSEAEPLIFYLSDYESASDAELEDLILTRGMILSPIPSLSQVEELSSGIIMSSSYTDSHPKPYSI